MSVKIHPTALVEKGAEFADGVEIGPYCIVSAQTRLGKDTRLHSHVVTYGHFETGSNNEFYPFCVMGAPPQDFSYKGEPTSVVIGNHNIFRESCTVHRGTPKDRGVTRIGDHNFIMAFCHFAHDNLVGNHVIMANQAACSGHVTVGDHVVIGGQSGVAQWCRLGDYSFVGGVSAIRRDLPPYMCAKEFSQVSGPNLVGLKRNGVGEESVRMASEMYKILYLRNLRTEKAVEEIEERYKGHPFAQKFVSFIKETKVGIQR